MTLADRFLQKLLLLLVFLLQISLLFLLLPLPRTKFQSESSYRYLVELQSNGPRTPNSIAHLLARQSIITILESNGWTAQLQMGKVKNHTLYNIYATKGTTFPNIILASHYDSRMMSDNDPFQSLKIMPVPGANDGGSGSSILLELSRVLPPDAANRTMMVFFDLEDQGNIDGWEWILGSQYFVENLPISPQSMILLDMVGDYDQKIIPPSNSDVHLYEEIRSTADALGYSNYFSNLSHNGILDDHVPFLEKGIPAIDLIDIHDNRWHTTQDDLENVNPISLQRIGDTLYDWITKIKD